MLTYRTNILFDEETMRILKLRAASQKTSVGKLVRKAVRDAYMSEEEKIQAQRKKAFEEILRIRPPVSKTPIDYKELINAGRKY